jgi:formylglycine-generating enzyme required for sulfatase activity
LPDLQWQIHESDPDDLDSPGKPMAEVLVVRGTPALAPDHLSRTEHIEARGGKAFLVVTGRGRASDQCPPSIVPIRQLPGYAQRDRAEPVLRVRVPTCQTTRADTILIPAGNFVHGGLGEPALPGMPQVKEEAPEEVIALPAFWIDRTEVTNAALAMYAEMEVLTGISMPAYPAEPWAQYADRPLWPAAGITWGEARAYCRFLGKELPTSNQWEKTMRGGLFLRDGAANPSPRRNLPWGVPRNPAPANLADTGTAGPAAVGTFAGDVSPYGVLDLAGNVQEWTGSTPSTASKLSRGFRIIRGGDWGEVTSETLAPYTARENQRPTEIRHFNLGMRCVLQLEGQSAVP